MSGKEKIQNLTHAWYGVSFASAIIGIVSNGLNVLSIALAIATTMFGIFVAWFFGFLLLRKSSFTRVALVVLSAIGVVAGVIGAGKQVFDAFFGNAPFIAGLGAALVMSIGVYMNARSFRVLTDRSVKAYFA